MGLSAIEIFAIVGASILVLVMVAKCCMTVSKSGKRRPRRRDFGHDNTVYVLPQHGSFFEGGTPYGTTYIQSSTSTAPYRFYATSTPVYYYPQPVTPVEERPTPLLPVPSVPSADPPPPYSTEEHRLTQHR